MFGIENMVSAVWVDYRFLVMEVMYYMEVSVLLSVMSMVFQLGQYNSLVIWR